MDKLRNSLGKNETSKSKSDFAGTATKEKHNKAMDSLNISSKHRNVYFIIQWKCKIE
jgi:hypothetical protein